MKTKQIPVIIMMISGFITCLTAVFNRMEMSRFITILIIVLISFYILGHIIKFIMDKNFIIETKEQEQDYTEEEEVSETEEEATEAVKGETGKVNASDKLEVEPEAKANTKENEET